MNKFLVNLADRVGSTAVQAFAGAVAAGTVGGIVDWRTAAVTAGTAALFALAKALGVTAAQSTTAVVQNGGSVTIDEQALVKALGDKLAGK